MALSLVFYIPQRRARSSTTASGVWPNMVKPEYTLRALTPGTGTFSIATSEGIAAGTFESADIARTVIDPSCNVLLYDAQDRRLTDDSIPAQDPQCELWRAALFDELDQLVEVVASVVGDMRGEPMRKA